MCGGRAFGRSRGGDTADRTGSPHASTHAIRNGCALVNDGANNDDDNACAYVNA